MLTKTNKIPHYLWEGAETSALSYIKDKMIK